MVPCEHETKPCPRGVLSEDDVCPNRDGTYGPGHWDRPHPEANAWWSRGGKKVLPGIWLRVVDPETDFQARATKVVGAKELRLSGLSRWAPHQLDGEIVRGDWWICYPDVAEILALPPSKMHDMLARDALQVSAVALHCASL